MTDNAQNLTANQQAENTLAISATNISRVFRRRVRGSGLAAAFKSFVSAKYSDKTAVNSLSFKIPRGSCVGLVGANGAGKTTLLKMCAGLLHPSSGEVSVLGFTPTDRRPAFQKKIGMVMGQKSQLWIDIPAMETFELLAAIYEIPDDVFKSRVEQLASIFQVKDQLNVQVRRLSLGERMKLEIIAALLHNPEILILDEPTIGLDVLARRTIRQFIREYNKEHNTTIILSSHDMTDIQEVCSRLLLIASGSLVYDGSLSDFEANYSRSENLRLRNVSFQLDFGQEISRAQAQSVAHQVQAQLTNFEAGHLTFSIDKSQIPQLIHGVTQLATPGDIRIEGQSLEAIVHDLMLGQRQNPA